MSSNPSKRPRVVEEESFIIKLSRVPPGKTSSSSTGGEGATTPPNNTVVEEDEDQDTKAGMVEENKQDDNNNDEEEQDATPMTRLSPRRSKQQQQPSPLRRTRTSPRKSTQHRSHIPAVEEKLDLSSAASLLPAAGTRDDDYKIPIIKEEQEETPSRPYSATSSAVHSPELPPASITTSPEPPGGSGLVSSTSPTGFNLDASPTTPIPTDKMSLLSIFQKRLENPAGGYYDDIPMSQNLTMLRARSEFAWEEDRYLILRAVETNWDMHAIHADITTRNEFKFDHFIHCLTPEDLEYHLVALARLFKFDLDEKERHRIHSSQEKAKRQQAITEIRAQERALVSLLEELGGGSNEVLRPARTTPLPPRIMAVLGVTPPPPPTAQQPLPSMLLVPPPPPPSTTSPDPTLHQSSPTIASPITASSHSPSSNIPITSRLGDVRNRRIDPKHYLTIQHTIVASGVLGMGQLVNRLIKQHPTECAMMSKRQLRRTIGALAIKEKRAGDRAAKWYAKPMVTDGNGTTAVLQGVDDDNNNNEEDLDDDGGGGGVSDAE